MGLSSGGQGGRESGLYPAFWAAKSSRSLEWSEALSITILKFPVSFSCFPHFSIVDLETLKTWRAASKLCPACWCILLCVPYIFLNNSCPYSARFYPFSQPVLLYCAASDAAAVALAEQMASCERTPVYSHVAGVCRRPSNLVSTCLRDLMVASLAWCRRCRLCFPVMSANRLQGGAGGFAALWMRRPLTGIVRPFFRCLPHQGRGIMALRALASLAKGCARRRVSRPTAPKGRLLGRDEGDRRTAVEGFPAGTPINRNTSVNRP